MLDSDLARIYGVPTKAFNQAVRRNVDKFPADFMFRLTAREAQELQRSRSQIVTLKRGQNIKYLPYVFTEHGPIMAANVLNSAQAVQIIRSAGIPQNARLARRQARVGKEACSFGERFKATSRRARSGDRHNSAAGNGHNRSAACVPSATQATNWL